MCIAKNIIWGLAGILLGTLALAGEEIAITPETKKIDVQVRVVDRLGKPISGAAVQAWRNVETQPLVRPIRAERVPINDRLEILTDNDGWARFSLTLQPKEATSRSISSCVCFTAEAKGCLVTRTCCISPAKSDHFEVLITLLRLVNIEGRVIDGQGRPVADAVVFHTGNASPRVEVKTDTDGRFKLDGLPEGKAPIFVAHPEYHFHGQLIDTAAAQELKLLGKDQSPPPRETLPPLLSHEEELQIAKQVIQPLWESTMKSADEGEKEWISTWYAKVDPWYVYDELKKRAKKDSSVGLFIRKMPLFYATDPEEALSVLESLETEEGLKAFALLETVHSSPELSRKKKLELLDRAMQHAKAIVKPDDRIERLSGVALELYDASATEEAKKIVDEYAPQALPNLPKGNAYACAIAGQVIALFDLPAGVKLARSAQGRDDTDDFYRMRSLFHIAYRCAKSKPAEAERIVTEALESSRETSKKYWQKEYQRDPNEEELCCWTDYNEARLVPICYWMSASDPDRAERIADTIHNPYSRAYALGMVAKALASEDKPRARKDILQSFEILAEAIRNPKRYWLDWQSSPPVAAGALLPTVEEIDPSLVEECMWQAISFRLHRPTDDLLIGSYPEHSDGCLAAYVARYDRDLAVALFPAKKSTITPDKEDESDYTHPLECLAVIDPRQALKELGADGSAHLGERRVITEYLCAEWSHRWNALSSQLYLWTPDYELFQSSFSW
jgi:hypothetical protein